MSEKNTSEKNTSERRSQNVTLVTRMFSLHNKEFDAQQRVQELIIENNNIHALHKQRESIIAITFALFITDNNWIIKCYSTLFNDHVVTVNNNIFL